MKHLLSTWVPWGSILLKTHISPSKISAGLWSPLQVPAIHAYFSPEQLATRRFRELEIKLADVCSCSYTPTTFGATITCIKPEASSLFESRIKSPTAWSQYSKTSMATFGI